MSSNSISPFTISRIRERIERVRKEDWVRILTHTQKVEADRDHHILRVQMGGERCILVADDILEANTFCDWFRTAFGHEIFVCAEQWCFLINSWFDESVDADLSGFHVVLSSPGSVVA